jgi:DNA-binding MarR family transcriptional regulator
MANPKQEPFHGNPSRQLNHVARLITREFDRMLAPLGVNVAYLSVLGALKDSVPLSQRELTEMGGIGQPAMAQMLDRMVKEGLLVREPDSVDRRRVMFTLSQAGVDLMPEVGKQIDEGNAEIFSVLGPGGLERLSSLLKTLEGHLGSQT